MASSSSSARGCCPGDAIPLQEWDSFVDALSHDGFDQEVRSDFATNSFRPAISSVFEACLSALGNKPVVAADAIKILLKFGAGEDSDELHKLVQHVEKATSNWHLMVQLVYCYTLETFFYRRLNAALREDDADVLGPISPIIKHMALMPIACPKLLVGRILLFRGLKLEDSEGMLYTEGLVFCWAGFSSFSKDRSRAERFAQDHGTIFVLEASAEVARSSLTDIEDLSYYPHEREVLLSPYASLVVRGTNTNDQHRNVHCELLSAGKDLSGVWDCAEDDGVYFVTCVGNLVAWFGHARPGGRYSWAHIFFGSLKGSELQGTFADVPVARDRFSGEIVCDVDFQGMRMTRTLERCSFIGKHWRRRYCAVQVADRPRLSHCPNKRDEGVTGCWQDDVNDIVFFAREYGNNLAWFAHSRSWTCAHVAIGKLDEHIDQSWVLVYHDTLLSSRFRYSGKIRVTSTSTGILSIERLAGPFASQVLRRVA